MTEREIKKIVNKLVGKDALSWRLREDGFLVVINAQGWKVTFSAEEVQRAMRSLKMKPEVENDPA